MATIWTQTKLSETNKLDSRFIQTSEGFLAVSRSEKNTWNDKSKVSVSNTGSATEVVNYITVNGVEKKIAGSGGGGTYTAGANINISSEGIISATYTAGYGININGGEISTTGSLAGNWSVSVSNNGNTLNFM